MGDIGDIIMRVDRSQAERAVKTRSRAFQSYPMIQHTFPHKDEREIVCGYFFGVAVRYGIRYGIVNTVTPEFEGVAIWLPPGSFPMTFGKLLRSVPFSTMVGFVRAGDSRDLIKPNS